MDIYLFGVSNVGKSTIGKLLAEKLGYSYYDLDDEVRKYYGITLEQFVNTGNLFFRDARRTEVMKKIAGLKNDKVVAVTPMTYI